MISNIDTTLLHVNIQSQDKNYFKGTAYSITSVNNKGEFDILPLHANFISLIMNYLVVDRALGTEKKFVISKGIIRNSKNKVDVFLD